MLGFIADDQCVEDGCLANAAASDAPKSKAQSVHYLFPLLTFSSQ